MRFWDSSAIVPLTVRQPRSEAARAALADDPALVVWWATRIECAAALARIERERGDGSGALADASRQLDDLARAWREVEPNDRLRDLAVRVLRTHPLRTGDALQLAAALTASDSDPRTLPFVTLDERLALAADKEGFPVIVPG